MASTTSAPRTRFVPTSTKAGYSIIAGPSDQEVSNSLMRKHKQGLMQIENPDRIFAIQFTSNDASLGIFWAVIDCVEREDGSGNSFNIRGRTMDENGSNHSLPFSGYYNTRTRRGVFRFIP